MMQTITLAQGDATPADLRDAELVSAPFSREVAEGDTSPERIGASPSLVDATNAVIHDVPTVGWWANLPGVAADRRLYDVMVCNAGWKGTDRGHGHALYTQNYKTGGERTVDTCVFIAGFGEALHLYGTNREISPNGWVIAMDEEGNVFPMPYNPGTLEGPWNFLNPRNKLANYHIRRSVFVGARSIVGNEGVSPWGAHSIHIDDCAFLASRLLMGYQGQNGDGSVTDCLLTDGLVIGSSLPSVGYRDAESGKLVSWRSLYVRGNVVIIPRGRVVRVTLPSLVEWEWDGNTYWSEEPRPFELVEEGAKGANGLPTFTTRRLTFAEWVAETGFDRGSIYHDGLPTEAIVRAYPVLREGMPTATITAAYGVRVPAGVTVVYPPANPVGWDGPAPAVAGITQPIAVWREAVAEEPADGCDALRERIAELEAALAASEARTAGLAADLEAERAEAARLQEELAARLSRIESLFAELDAARARIAGLEAMLREAAGQIDALKEQAAADRPVVEAARGLWSAAAQFAGAVGNLTP